MIIASLIKVNAKTKKKRVAYREWSVLGRGGEGKLERRWERELERRKRERDRERDRDRNKKIMKKNEQVEINFFQWNP